MSAVGDVVQGQGLVGLTEIEAASRRLAGIIVPTPLLPADAVSEAVDAHVRLKCESLQRAGSFKIRGAYNFVSQLSDEQIANGIITYSSGNHAQAVALAGGLRGVRVVVVMPTTASGRWSWLARLDRAGRWRGAQPESWP